MKLRHLRYFVRIVEAGSISRAAALIPVAQPALSQQIAELEEFIGQPLLHRSVRGVKPTTAGEVLFREAQDILRQVDRLPDVVRSTGGEAQGVVTLGVASTLASHLGGALMEACRRALPKIMLRLVTSDSAALLARVDDHTVDLAIAFEDQLSGPYRRVPLFRQQLMVVRRKGPPRAARTIDLAELARIPLVLPAAPNVARASLDRAFAEAGLDPLIVGEADVFASLIAAVQSGVASTVMPRRDFSDERDARTLMAVTITPPLYLHASLIHATDASPTRAASAVGELVRDFIFAHLGDSALAGAERAA